jgi:hypothetical protein
MGEVRNKRAPVGRGRPGTRGHWSLSPKKAGNCKLPSKDLALLACLKVATLFEASLPT